jgi:hypothetical protein
MSVYAWLQRLMVYVTIVNCSRNLSLGCHKNVRDSIALSPVSFLFINFTTGVAYNWRLASRTRPLTVKIISCYNFYVSCISSSSRQISCVVCMTKGKNFRDGRNLTRFADVVA